MLYKRPADQKDESLYMTSSRISKLREKSLKNQKKRDAKREQIAQTTLTIWSRLGYSETSLRDIADECGIAVSVLLYYFEDKTDLILYSIQLYQKEFESFLDRLLDETGDAKEVGSNTIRRSVESIKKYGERHRLSFDIRAQALFDPHFKELADDMEKAQLDLTTRFLKRVGLTNIDPFDYFLNVDNRFRYFLQKHLAGDKNAADELGTSLVKLFDDYRYLNDNKPRDLK